MARVATFVPDLLFGSKVLAAVATAEHESLEVADVAALAGALGEADGLIVDLTSDAPARVAAVRAATRARHVPVLGFYSHVEADVRALALDAGFSLVVPRSRMAREGAALVARLLTTPAPAGPTTPSAPEEVPPAA